MYYTGQSVQHVGTGKYGRVVLNGVRMVAVMWDGSTGDHEWSLKQMVKPLPYYEQDVPETPAVEQIARDNAYGYASAYGYAAQQLEFIRSKCDAVLRYYAVDKYVDFPREIGQIRDMADRAIQDAKGALERYAARIETLEDDTQH